MQNQLATQQAGTQLVGEVAGQAADALRDNGVQGFDEGEYGRVLTEAALNAGVFGATGGSALAAASSTVASGLLTDYVNEAANQAAAKLTSDPKAQEAIARVLGNSMASALGLGAGALTGSSTLNGALAGGGSASNIYQYNQMEDEREGENRPLDAEGRPLSINEEVRTEIWNNNREELKRLDPDNPVLTRKELRPASDALHSYVPSEAEAREVHEALEVARKVERAQGSTEGLKDLVTNGKVGSENLKQAASGGKTPSSIDDGEEAFNPAGTMGAARLWTKSARLKQAQLPTQGKIRFVPPDDYNATASLDRGPSKGYYDRFGNEWVKGPSRTPGEPFEWDVQLSSKGQAQLGWASRDGKHLNVSLKGEITH
ncbi:polymorphic toxin type 17 domain-containing protein [Entomobacter blattae]|uniref:polymorphic toxin type 17 domain-containing protein n=1 Tax=Entomobacter blattae TaxID=2762277 RepID=UPI00193BFB56|nr:polymorphic toxin type 17 domain-containing protein [Entomobacter blattae]